jgi:hypothetical protein
MRLFLVTRICAYVPKKYSLRECLYSYGTLIRTPLPEPSHPSQGAKVGNVMLEQDVCI